MFSTTPFADHTWTDNLATSSSLFLSTNTVDDNVIANLLLASPVFWTTSVLLIIVGMLVAWDELVERARQATPLAGLA